MHPYSSLYLNHPPPPPKSNNSRGVPKHVQVLIDSQNTQLLHPNIHSTLSLQLQFTIPKQRERSKKFWFRNPKPKKKNVPSVRSHGGDSKQSVVYGVPNRHGRSSLRRSRGRQHRSSPRQQVRLREMRSSEAIARSHCSRLRRLQFLPSGSQNYNHTTQNFA